MAREGDKSDVFAPYQPPVVQQLALNTTHAMAPQAFVGAVMRLLET
jgi:hypothetical protein